MNHSKDTLVPQRNCYNTTLAEFIQREINGSWEYSDADWKNVQAEYVDLLKDDRLDGLFELRKEISKLQNKILLTQQAIDGLKVMYYQPLCDALRGMGYRINFTPDTLLNNLQQVITLANSHVLRRDELISQYNLAAKKLQPKESKITEQYFTDNLVVLGKFMGYRLEKSMFLAEYISIKNNFAQHIKALEHGSRPN